jgi:hypothetical protein
MAIVLLAAVTACGLSSDGGNDTAPLDERSSAGARGRIESCVDRLLQNARPQEGNHEAARRYVRETYCARFESHGWIYDDGALSITAPTWLGEGGTCSTSREGEPAITVPCEEVRPPGPRILDCALLHHARKREVRDYIERLQREGAVECDDGTPLENLGVP